MKKTKFELTPISLAKANAFVEQFHRHHRKTQGQKFSLAASVDGNIVGVIIVGRPVARGSDDGTKLEITRLCTDGTYNACSFLIGAAARATWALGYTSLGTYILETEDGSSLKASGFKFSHVVRGRSWTCPSRPRTDKHPTVNKQFWFRDK